MAPSMAELLAVPASMGARRMRSNLDWLADRKLISLAAPTAPGPDSGQISVETDAALHRGSGLCGSAAVGASAVAGYSLGNAGLVAMTVQSEAMASTCP